MSSPLGQYAAPAAAFVSIAIILTTLLALMFSVQLQIAQQALEDLKLLSALAAGALFGSSVAVNGYKAPLAAVHKRLDAMGAPPAADGP